MDLYKPERVTGTYYYKNKYTRLKKAKEEAEMSENQTDYTPDIVDQIQRAKQIIEESKKTETPLHDFTLNETMLKKYSANFKKY